ncbi:3-phosphoshikimate 1-carboxyvinyltransferase [Clostridium cellulovorans]|uniref:3-phosphoshikimate 1-carboxyvinyltransferase n=1 Tax=Clostridium cellulovorans (strain ATCC 35296 / DSM 3052 / OCM 3 / 743B) TaxID=573061 RepID=D9ST29_CLOC7|nr:3-phosphoshikimate 1-carboxyvinyltransferase [Clostridium cellulovorans]ADL52691.1 3-phosphoshikimate 1-carboxyvinyltransferase [Clostridium cellulovorans 743B]
MTEKVYEVKVGQNFIAEIDVPGSKSVANRALIIAALAEGTTVLKNMLFSDDTRYMMEAIRKLGNTVEVDEQKRTVIVKSAAEKVFPETELFIGNAGTAMRFLPTYISAGKGKVSLTGIERMKERPIKDLVDGLRELGVEVTYKEKDGFPPFEIDSNGLPGGEISIRGDKSSQYLTSILLSAPYAKEDVTVKIQGKLVSIPYVDITIRMMKDFGVEVENRDYKEFFIKSGQKYKSREYIVEGDCSSASYFFGIAAITNSEIKVNNVCKNTMQGDIKLLDVLEKMGVSVSYGENHVLVKGSGKLRGITVDMHHMSDVAQTLSVVALFADGVTKIENVYNMRIKETDRIKAVYNELMKLGAKVTELEDGLIIEPAVKYNENVEIDTYDDHRMAMSFSLAGLRIPGVKIKDPDCVSKTFPSYFEEFEKIYNR